MRARQSPDGRTRERPSSLSTAVDRALLQQYLVKIERNIAEGEIKIARHWQVIDQQQRDVRRPSATARMVLRSLEETQAALITTRDTIRKKLRDG